MTRQTSLLAYKEVKKDLGPRQKQVYETVKDLGPCTYLTICESLGLYPNSVTPRLGELLSRGYIREAYIKVGPTGHKMAYYAAEEDEPEWRIFDDSR